MIEADHDDGARRGHLAADVACEFENQPRKAVGCGKTRLGLDRVRLARSRRQRDDADYKESDRKPRERAKIAADGPRDAAGLRRKVDGCRSRHFQDVIRFDWACEAPPRVNLELAN